MDSRLRFRPRPIDDELPGGPRNEAAAVLWMTVKGRSRDNIKARADDECCGATQCARAVESAGEKSPGGSLWSVRTVNRHR
jgi:hypothetical protein